MKRLDHAETGEVETPMPVATTGILVTGDLGHGDGQHGGHHPGGDPDHGGACLEDVEWQHVDRSTDNRYFSLASPRADSSLPPISKSSRQMTGGLSPEPTTPRKLVHSLGLSKSQNSLTKLKFSETGDFGYLRNIGFADRQVEKLETHTSIARSDPRKASENSNPRAVAKSQAYQKKLMPWESARLSPVISADNINNRVIMFLAADNTLHPTPAYRNKMRASVPTRSIYINSSQNMMTTSHSTARRLASNSREELNPAMSHSPVSRTLPFSKVYPRKSRNSMRTRVQVIPQTKSTEKNVSIRRKIEQYRKKYDEQYTDKLKRLKLDGDHDIKPSHSRPNTLPFSAIDFTKILESRIHEHILEEGKVAQTEKQRQAPKGKDNDFFMYAKNEKHSLMSSSVFESRPMSRATWKTWRDVNESDAYTDVAQYIRDNDLMDAERERWITMWIADVQSAMKNMDVESDIHLIDS